MEEALRAHPRPPARVVVWLLRQMARALLFAQVFLSLCLSLFLSLSFSLSRSLSLALSLSLARSLALSRSRARAVSLSCIKWRQLEGFWRRRLTHSHPCARHNNEVRRMTMQSPPRLLCASCPSCCALRYAVVRMCENVARMAMRLAVRLLAYSSGPSVGKSWAHRTLLSVCRSVSLSLCYSKLASDAPHAGSASSAASNKAAPPRQ